MRNVRVFPQTKLDSEINARFLLNEHGDPHFLFYKFNENSILNKLEKNWQKSMATFLANEINATDRDVIIIIIILLLIKNIYYSRAQQSKSKLCLFKRMKILINNARYLQPFFLGRR